jgi:hypothetical protein
MRLHDIFTLLDFLSRAMAVMLAIAGVVGFAFHKAIEAWIDTRFKAKADEALEGYKAQLAESLESKKAELARQLEEQKARLAKDLERDKQSFTEGIRREAYEFDKNRSYYETFDLEFGTVISELYALHADYITRDPNNPLIAQWRDIWLSRSHAMLIEADKKLRALDQYIGTDLKVRVARLFSDLSRFMAEGARNKEKLDQLALENGLLTTELRNLVKGRPESPR